MESNQRPLSDFISSIEQVDAPEEVSNNDEQKPQKKKITFLIIVSVLLVLIIGVGVYYFSTSKPDEQEMREIFLNRKRLLMLVNICRYRVKRL